MGLLRPTMVLFWLAITLASLVLPCLAAEGVVSNAELEALLKAPHGLYRLPPAQRQVLERIQAQPEVYAPLISKMTREYLDKKEFLLTGAGVGLLCRLGQSDSSEIAEIVQLFEGWIEQELKRGGNWNDLRSLEAVTLSAINARDDRIVDLAIRGIASRSPLLIAPLKSYLIRVGGGNVREKLDLFLQSREIPRENRDILISLRDQMMKVASIADAVIAGKPLGFETPVRAAEVFLRGLASGDYDLYVGTLVGEAAVAVSPADPTTKTYDADKAQRAREVFRNRAREFLGTSEVRFYEMNQRIFADLKVIRRTTDRGKTQQLITLRLASTAVGWRVDKLDSGPEDSIK